MQVTPFTITLNWVPPCDHGERVAAHLLEMALVSSDTRKQHERENKVADRDPPPPRGDELVVKESKQRQRQPDYEWVEVSRLLAAPTRYVQGLDPGAIYVFRTRVRFVKSMPVLVPELIPVPAHVYCEHNVTDTSTTFYVCVCVCGVRTRYVVGMPGIQFSWLGSV